MTTILRLFPKTIFFLDHQVTDELKHDRLMTKERATLLGVRERFPSAKWVDVLKDQKIAIPVGPELMTWFLPDSHKNDLGVTIYGKAVASFLIARVRSRGEVE
jgi:hypothetical protein